MESIVEKTIRTNAIPRQVVGTLRHYSQCLTAAEAALVRSARGEPVTITTADTGGKLRSFWAGHNTITTLTYFVGTVDSTSRGVASTGLATLSAARSFVTDVRVEVTSLLIDGFNSMASILAIQSAIAEESKETTKGIESTVLENRSILEELKAASERARQSCRSTARSLLKHATGWAGNDLPELLTEVRRTRSKISF